VAGLLRAFNLKNDRRSPAAADSTLCYLQEVEESKNRWLAKAVWKAAPERVIAP